MREFGAIAIVVFLSVMSYKNIFCFTAGLYVASVYDCKPYFSYIETKSTDAIQYTESFVIKKIKYIKNEIDKKEEQGPQDSDSSSFSYLKSFDTFPKAVKSYFEKKEN
jgi:hypothetical protein